MVLDPTGDGEAGARRVLLGELLVQANVITQEQLTEVLGAPREPGKKLGQMLIERGWITEAQLTQTLSLQLSVPWVSLYHIDFSRQLLNRVARELAERYCLIPIFVRHVKGQGETLYVAMDDPTHETALAEVSKQAGLPARPMIASATDIRSAIRVYYGDGPASSPDVTLPAVMRPDSPMTTREGRGAVPREPTSDPTAVPTRPDPPKVGGDEARAEARGAAGSQPDESGPLTRRSSPPSAGGEGAKEARRSRPEGGEGAKKGRPRMVSLTLLDGTTLQLPAKKKGGPAGDGLTARDFVSALRATAHGADATEILGEQPKWEPVVAALLSILLRKGLIADWEFVEELRKI